MAIITREDLKGWERPTLRISLPELGPEAEVVVQAFSAADRANIQAQANRMGADGVMRYDPVTDTRLSLLAALAEPKVNLVDDGEWILNLPIGATQRVITTAAMLGGSTVDEFQALKESVRANPYLRRMFVACQRLFHRFPSELDHISETEFNTALAALEIQAEEEEQAAKG